MLQTSESTRLNRITSGGADVEAFAWQSGDLNAVLLNVWREHFSQASISQPNYYDGA